MELWQLDVVGGLLVADGTKAKILTRADDHFRFSAAFKRSGELELR